jgi:hypothetical protein
MVGVADLRYVLNDRDMQHRTFAVRKFWAENKNTAQLVLSDQRLEGHVVVRKAALEGGAHPRSRISSGS